MLWLDNFNPLNGLNNNESIHYSFLMPNYTRSSSTTLLTENTQNSIHFKLFPNPANSSIRLQTISAEKVNARILMFDIIGKVVDTKSMNHAELFIDIETLENGIYLVQITNNDTNEVETIRFVKH